MNAPEDTPLFSPFTPEANKKAEKHNRVLGAVLGVDTNESVNLVKAVMLNRMALLEISTSIDGLRLVLDRVLEEARKEKDDD